MFVPELNQFRNYYREKKRVPVMVEVPVGVNTPITVIEKLNLAGAPLCLLESGKGMEDMARYSFLGFEPFLTFRSRGTSVEVISGDSRKAYIGDPYTCLQDTVESFQGVKYEGLSKFWGGAMGYFSYDMGRHFERLPEETIDDLQVPDCYFMFFDKIICFDHLKRTMQIIVTVCPDILPNPNDAYMNACEEISRVFNLISHRREADDFIVDCRDRALRNTFVPECNVTKEQFEDMVVCCKEYIRAGDIFQANLSLRLAKNTSVEPFFLYKVLRQVNPSPYMSFINFGDMHIVSSSPELLVRLAGDLAETRPIAGTRRRGNDREEDLALAHELISNEKERAEHIMLVDLERNDLGRVCRFGTVEVNELMVIEEYSHVMHIVSNVRGHLAEGRNRFDLFRACFPGGTITGAPKIRSMEIIEELEPTRRGPYTGSVGFLGYTGEMEMNIVIRTILMKNGKAYIQAGAGIVADSIPEKEYFESMKKAEALLRAIEISEELQRDKNSHDAQHIDLAGEPYLVGGEIASA